MVRLRPKRLVKQAVYFVLLIFFALHCHSTASAQIIISDQDLADTARAYKTTDPAQEVKVFQDKMPPVISDSKKRAEILQNLPMEVQKLRINDQELENAVRRVLAPALKLYGREAAYDILVFKHSTPIMFSDTGVVIVVSTGMLERIQSDDELLGYVLHEIGHEYYASYSIFSRHVLKLVLEGGKEEVLSRKMTETLAIVELQSDSFAALSLAYLKYNPSAFIAGIEKIGIDFPTHGYGFHPPDATRRKLIEQVLQPKYFQVKPKTSLNLKNLKDLLKENLI